MTKPIFISGIDKLLSERATDEAAQATDTQTPWIHGGHAITSIILAVAGIEAHVGEWLARPANRARFTQTELDRFKQKPAHEVAKAIIKKCDPSYDFNHATWHLRLLGLHQLRNHVVHYYPEKRDTGTFPPDLEPYINNTFAPAGDSSMDWTSRLLVRRVALRAVEIAEEAAREFDNVVAGW